MHANIHPIYDCLTPRHEREARLGQRGKVLWLTGLSGAGKSTIAAGLEQRLFREGFFAQVLDGDNIRTGINSNLGFSPESRLENIRRIAEVAKLYLISGIITVNCFISPAREMRELAKAIIGASDFIEIYINAPLDVCEQRDVKGLYQKARRGEIKEFTGVDAPYEHPEKPALEIHTAETTIDAAVETAFQFLLPLITLKQSLDSIRTGV
ncbi:adenylyl-sulfate kinase [Spirosoma sp. HMF4905]|uniref:Adenylyl-sulfate kinase n=1 Tax=Spirosoma arboris TaxID=2682092 RepID=A0A7K1SN33_9BACT|nr:adenylyl-sulfate kinase [Spirosoma arboris]MVM35209.1 adenylyl-sulfate kinase [Spirosoma arboris]